MRKLLEGIKAGFQAGADSEVVRSGELSVDQLVDLMEKHQVAETTAGDFHRAVNGGIRKFLSASPSTGHSPSANAVMTTMEALINKGKEGQDAVLDFCKNQRTFEIAKFVLDYEIRPQLFNAGGKEMGIVQSVLRDPGFADFVEKVIAGHDAENPVSKEVDGFQAVQDRASDYSRLRERVRKLAGSEPSAPSSDLG